MALMVSSSCHFVGFLLSPNLWPWQDRGKTCLAVVPQTNLACVGENLAAGYGTGWTDAIAAAESAVGLWYAEESQYNYNDPVFSGGTGHFTQLVWAASTQIGFGAALATSGNWIVVAEFDPPGNVQGQFAANVLP